MDSSTLGLLYSQKESLQAEHPWYLLSACAGKSWEVMEGLLTVSAIGHWVTWRLRQTWTLKPLGFGFLALSNSSTYRIYIYICIYLIDRNRLQDCWCSEGLAEPSDGMIDLQAEGRNVWRHRIRCYEKDDIKGRDKAMATGEGWWQPGIILQSW